jgi:N-acetylmuramoyl-L-alanine amidase
MNMESNNDTKRRLSIRLLFVIIPVILAVTFAAYMIVHNNMSYKDAYMENEKLSGQSNTYSQSKLDDVAKIENKEPKEVIVVIDPGHGGEDLGTCYRDIYEKNLNLDVSIRLGKLLENNGIKVVYTRTGDESVELKTRSEIANNINASLFISVHNNNMPDNTNYRGTETLYCLPERTDQHTMDGEKFARVVQEELVKTLGTIDNGTINRPNLSVLRRTKMPAVIAEIAYLSNSSDRAKITSPEFRQKAAEALERAVLKVLAQMKANKDSEGKWVLSNG